MADPIRIVIRFDVQRTSPNRRMHLYERARENGIARETARAEWLKAGSPRSEVPVLVDVILRRARRLDHDNAWASIKGVADGIFNRALTPTDSPKWVRLGELTQECARSWRGREEVEFIISPREDPNALSQPPEPTTDRDRPAERSR